MAQLCQTSKRLDFLYFQNQITGKLTKKSLPLSSYYFIKKLHVFKLFPLARDFLEKSGNYDTVIVHKKIRSQYESDALFTEVVIYTQGKYDFLTLCATWEGGLVDTRLFPLKKLKNHLCNAN